MKRFAGNVEVMEAEPAAFVAELFERWKARKAADGPLTTPAASRRDRPASGQRSSSATREAISRSS